MSEKQGHHPSPIQKQTLTCFDSEQLSNVVKGADFELHQLDKGSFRADLLSISLGNGILDRGCYSRSVLTQGLFPQEYITCGFVHHAQKEGRLNGSSMQKYDMVLSDKGGVLDYHLAPNTLWSSFQFKPEDLQKTGITLGKNFSNIYRLDPQMQQTLSFGLSEAFRLLEKTHEDHVSFINKEMLYNHILSLYAHAFDQADETIHLKQDQSAFYAKEILYYIHTHANEPIQMIDLTALIGKGERTVERLFKKHFGIAPYAYLKIHRLHLVRKHLMQTDPCAVNITHLAMENGFMQMGYFCSEYKKMFGETASETLSRGI